MEEEVLGGREEERCVWVKGGIISNGFIVLLMGYGEVVGFSMRALCYWECARDLCCFFLGRMLWVR